MTQKIAFRVPSKKNYTAYKMTMIPSTMIVFWRRYPEP